MAESKYIYALGRRKTSVATVRLFEGKGDFEVNGMSYKEYFSNFTLESQMLGALEAVAMIGKFHGTVKVMGGGKNAQSEAIRLAISKALVELDENYKPILKKAGFLSRDPRSKERKKYGLKKARKAPQFSKR